MQCVSRSGLIHGQSSAFKSADELNDRKRDTSKANARRDDVWYDFERVLLVSFLFANQKPLIKDHVGEVLSKACLPSTNF